MRNKFETLIDDLRAGMISIPSFEKQMANYIESIYDSVNSHNYTKGSKYGTRSIDDAAIESIVKRIIDSALVVPDAIGSQGRGERLVKEFAPELMEDYTTYYCEEQKFDLGKIVDSVSKKTIRFILGLDTHTLFVQINSKNLNGVNRELKTSLCGVPNNDFVNLYNRKGESFMPYENSVFNGVTCLRFDPTHMGKKSTNGEDNDNHTNRFVEGGVVDNEELYLYKKYFKDVAHCPHFHYYRKSVCWQMFSNGYSFAININNLSRYLHDLDEALNTEDITNPILRYSLGMPFLGIAMGKIHCDTKPFLRTVWSILDRYYVGGERGSKIGELYDILLATRKYSDPEKTNILQLATATDIMCFVANENVQKKENFVVQTDREILDENKKAVLLTTLATKFTESIGETLNEKVVGDENFENPNDSNIR